MLNNFGQNKKSQFDEIVENFSRIFFFHHTSWLFYPKKMNGDIFNIMILKIK